MTQSWFRVAATATMVGIVFANPVRAQTNDESRLIIGIAAGAIGSAQLWDVPQQPVYSAFESPPTIYHLHRSVQSDVTVSGSATFFPNPHWGFVGDFTYLGLGTTDGCSIVQDDGDTFLAAACAALQGNQQASSNTAVNAGIVFRPVSRTLLQPYFKGMVGLAFTPSSTLTTVATTGFIGDTAENLTVYTDDSWHSIRPTWTAAFGISTAPSSGYEIHAEFRETGLALAEVTSASQGQGFVPPHRSVTKIFPSLLLGFDVVLEQRRGRRY